MGCIQARILLDKFGSASGIFNAKRSQLEHTEGIGTIRAEQIRKFSAHAEVEQEIVVLPFKKVKKLHQEGRVSHI